MPRNDQAVRRLIVFQKLVASRHGLTLDQLAQGLDHSAVRHPLNPVNRYHPDNPLNPANEYNPDMPFEPLDGGLRGRGNIR